MNDSKVLLNTADKVATITLNRPEKRNALDDDMVALLKQSFSEAERDENVRVILLTGAGKDFCSGADLSVLQKIAEGSILDNWEDANSLKDLFIQMRLLRKPIVAAVRGRALAGGCGLATACDIILAARSSQFGYPEVKIGFIPAIVMAILRRSVSEKRAFELITRGETFSAEQAERYGLINHVFDDDVFDSDVQRYLDGFNSTSASAVMLSKYLLYQMDGMTFESALRSGADLNAIARLTDDCKKGIAQFLKK
ncbi:MAG TPA: enoyl-CoA hydratase/isomerase family protein [Blastocatellia bacterium]|nr:enoyl-CoA hydratase/isomerase family protein [Blastocatellia bacterium]